MKTIIFLFLLFAFTAACNVYLDDDFNVIDLYVSSGKLIMVNKSKTETSDDTFYKKYPQQRQTSFLQTFKQ